MYSFLLRQFTKEDTFPLFIQYGHHENDLGSHTHSDFSELVIVLSGHAMHHVGNESFYVKKGDVFVLNENTTHSYHNAESFQICNIMFRMKDLINARYDITHTAGFHALFIIEPHHTQNDHFSSRLLLTAENFLNLKYHLDEMLEEYQSKQIGRETMLEAEFLYVITLLSRLYMDTSLQEETAILALANTISYMELHYRENLSIDELSQRSGYSKRHFTRLFKETYHTTPLDYILSLRIENACYLLCQPNNNISKTAIMCGFDNANYFCRIFKKRVGIAPSQYKNIKGFTLAE